MVEQVKDVWAGLPIWARLVGILGGPTVLTGYLVWVLVAVVQGDIASVRRDVTANTRSISLLETMTGAQNEKLEALIRLQLATCLNTSIDSAQRAGCMSAR